MEEYRKSVYQQLEDHNLLDMAMVSHPPVMVMLHLCFNKKIGRKTYCIFWRKKIVTHCASSEFCSVLPLCHQITRAAESSPAKDPCSLWSSPGLCSVPAKPHVSTDTFRKENKTNASQSQQSDAGAVVPKQSSQPDTPCTPAAGPKINVSANVMCQQCNTLQNLNTT